MKRFLSFLFLLTFLLATPALAWEAFPLSSLVRQDPSDGLNYVNDLEGARLDLLESWLADYASGRPASVTILSYTHPVRLAYTLTSDGSDTYTLEWETSDGRRGTLRQRGVYVRQTDYIFGDTFPQGFKGPFCVSRMALIPASYDVEIGLNSISPQEAIKIAAGAQVRLDEYLSRWQGAARTIRLDNPSTAPKTVTGNWQVTGCFSLGHEIFYQIEDLSSANWDGNAYAVSTTGSLVLHRAHGSAGWGPVYDGGETLLLPGKASVDGWTRNSL